MSETKAVEILQQELEKCAGFSEKVNHLSIKIKWGQNELQGIGNIKSFLEKHTDVFSFDGTSVTLVNAKAAGGKGKGPGKGPAPPGLIPMPMNSKAPGAPPNKRNYFDLDEDEEAPDAKAARQDHGAPIGSKAPAMSKGGKDGAKGDKGDFGAQKGAGAPTSKARSFGAPEYDDGKGKGKAVKGAGGFDGGKGGPMDGKGGGYGGKDSGFDGKGAGKDFGYQGKDGGFDGGKGGGFDGGKGGGFDGKGKGGAFDEKGKGGGFDGGKGGGFDGSKGGYDGGEKGGKDSFKGGEKGGKGPAEAEAPGASGPVLSPADQKQALMEDRLLPQQAQAGIESFKSNGVEIELSMLAKKLVPTEQARRNSQRCLALVRSAVSAQWGQPNGNAPSVELCGSHAQGTELLGSAMDLAFLLPSGLSFEEKSNYASELRNNLTSKPNISAALEVHDTQQVYPHTSSPLSLELKGSTPPLVAHILLEEQRVNRPPTLDEVIKQLCNCNEAAADMVRLVKIWSVNHGLTNHQEGFLDGPAWALLVVFFFQKQKLIPPYSYLSEGNHVAPTPSPMPLSSLLQSFFDFMVSRGQSPPGISVFTGEEFQGPPSPFIDNPAYFLETRQQRSLCESLGEAQWTRILDESKKAFNRIKVRPGRWFHWAEVFDPTDRKPAKIHGLAQTLAADLPTDAGKGGAPDGKGMDAKGSSKGFGAPDGKGMDGKGMDGKGMDGKGADAKGADAKGADAKGADFKGADGKGMPGKGAPGKDADGKGYSDAGKGGKDDFKGGKAGKESDAKGWSDKGSDAKGWSGDSKGYSDAGKGGKDDFKGSKAGKDDSKGYGKESSGKDAWSGKEGDSKGYGKDDGKGKGYGYGKDDGKGKGYGKGGKPY